MAMASAREMLSSACKLAGGMYCFYEYCGRPLGCGGPSMLPTLADSGDWVAYETFSLRSQRLSAGDVVVVTAPYDAKKLVIKRIVGMPGDQIEAPALNPWESHRTEIVPAGHVWLQGDNLAQSTDSRYYGAVSMNLIKGRVFAKIFPIWQSLPRTMEFAQQHSKPQPTSTL